LTEHYLALRLIELPRGTDHNMGLIGNRLGFMQ
jgi:hypothetical protein